MKTFLHKTNNWDLLNLKQSIQDPGMPGFCNLKAGKSKEHYLVNDCKKH